jgi:hypothetical protein
VSISQIPSALQSTVQGCSCLQRLLGLNREYLLGIHTRKDALHQLLDRVGDPSWSKAFYTGDKATDMCDFHKHGVRDFRGWMRILNKSKFGQVIVDLTLKHSRYPHMRNCASWLTEYFLKSMAKASK